MNIELFAQQIQEIHGRLAELYRGASASVQPPSDLLLPTAFKELGTASEELQVAAEELFHQNDKLAAMRSQLEVERQRYRDLFESLPDACLVTDAQGKIQDANRAAAKLLKIEPSNLVGKLLVSFIPLEKRGVFRSKLNQLHQRDCIQEWKLSMQRFPGELFDAAVKVAPVRDGESKAISWRWIVRDITEQERVLKVLTDRNVDLCQHRSKYCYTKGDFIPLDSQTIWLVCEGIVKLTTMTERGDEVLVGLVSPSMPFGSCITTLPTYQATPLSQQIQIVGISLSEVAVSPHLTQALLPKISQRLQQTELLLAICGKRHVSDRLRYLLRWLKQEFGQPTPQGSRLSLRLTHQDLADACCTTRVTITRLLGQLHKQGKIAFDSKNHICWIDKQYRKCS